MTDHSQTLSDTINRTETPLGQTDRYWLLIDAMQYELSELHDADRERVKAETDAMRYTEAMHTKHFRALDRFLSTGRPSATVVGGTDTIFGFCYNTNSTGLAVFKPIAAIDREGRAFHYDATCTLRRNNFTLNDITITDEPFGSLDDRDALERAIIDRVRAAYPELCKRPIPEKAR